jgi:hypothetical protein
MAWSSVSASRLLLAGSLLGCAPIAEMRPANGMMEGNTYEIGNALTVLGPRPYVEESGARVAQLWFAAEASKRWSFTAVTAFDKSALALGGAARLSLLRLDRFAWGTEVQVGYAFGAFTIPLSVRLFDQTWLYASPRLGTLGRDLTPSTPVGISIRLFDGFMLRSELAVSWADFKAYNRRVHFGLGVAAQW